jgi:alkanesulfonate monooxygenase SsuD/methylene tetrahydromethanopterin reductase-like flavin-dependent oxidoreductase (luciferase family)
MKFAGSRGLLPLSIGMFNASYLADHWAIYAESAAQAGLVADRENWRVSREIMVADTDAEARAWARDTFVAELWQSHLLPAMRIAGYLGHIKHDPSVSDEELWTIDYLMDHVWFVGSPDTVLERLRQDQRDSGGYGVVLLHQTDRGSNPDRYRRSLELVATELAPKLRAESALPART